MKRRIKILGIWILIFGLLELAGLISSIQLILEYGLQKSIIMSTLFAIWGFTVLILLFRLSPHARNAVREYLLVGFTYSIISLGIIWNQTNTLLTGTSYASILNATWAILWYTYFTKSKRMKEVYGNKKLSLTRTGIILGILILILIVI